jgi:hypothetical protein
MANLFCLKNEKIPFFFFVCFSSDVYLGIYRSALFFLDRPLSSVSGIVFDHGSNHHLDDPDSDIDVLFFDDFR